MEQEEFERKMRKLKREEKSLRASGNDETRLKKVRRDIRRVEEQQEADRGEEMK